jgi:hypothetical protein
MDPFTIAAIAGGAQALGGAAQSIFSGRKKAERELNAFAKQSPLYQGSKSINDYYQQALNRYNENPYQSQQYQLGAMNAQRATAQGIGALQDRRSAIGGVSRLALGQNAAMQNLGAQAEAQRNQRFSQLGQASQAKASEDYKMFDINQMTPYNRQLQLKQLAAQAANDRANAGLQMVGSALGGVAQAGIMAGSNKLPTAVTPDASNLTSYNTPVNSGFGANNQYGLYNSNQNTFTSANPSAFGTATGMFNKNPLAGRYSATKAFKPYGF